MTFFYNSTFQTRKTTSVVLIFIKLHGICALGNWTQHTNWKNRLYFTNVFQPCKNTAYICSKSNPMRARHIGQPPKDAKSAQETSFLKYTTKSNKSSKKSYHSHKISSRKWGWKLKPGWTYTVINYKTFVTSLLDVASLIS